MSNFLFDRLKILQVGLLLAGWIGFIYFASSILFFFDVAISAPSCWLVNLVYIAVVVFYFFRTKQVAHYSEIAYLLSASLILIIISLLISRWFIDYSYDGQAYHGEAIIKISNGWNPNYEHIPGDGIITLVINHFAKASWIAGGFLFKLTGNFECAKAGNIILMIANFYIAFYLFTKWFANKFISVILAALLACNPVWLNMYLGNMLDSQVANAMYIFILLMIISLTEKKVFVIPFLYFVIIYSTNLKFTVVAYNIIFIAAIILFLLIRKIFSQHRPLAIHLCFAMLIAVAVTGYQTYIKNTVEHGHPFYPFKGKNNVSDSTSVLAMDYRKGNSVINFIKSNFAATTYNQAYTQHLQYKIPFTVSRYELERFAFSGVIIGGFGVWFSGVIIISLLMLVWLTFINRRKIFTEYFPFYFFIGAIVVSILINPYAYIARYVPQYYLIPFAALLLWWLTFKKKGVIFYMLIIVMIINSLLISGYTYYNVVVSKKVKEQLIDLKTKNKKVLVNFRAHTSKSALFDEYKIPYRQVDTFSNKVIPDTLFRSEVIYSAE
ncbi:MAG: hypothetical protein ABIN97_02045 [Ginsengibacter sp.]